MRRTSLSSVLLTLTALLLAACGGAGPTGGADGAGGGGDDVPEGRWLLTAGEGPDGEVELRDGLAGDELPIVLEVDGADWGGTVCNRYGAQDVQAGDGEVRLGDLVATEMACLDDGVMVAEQRYLAALGAVERYEVAGDELRLTGPDVALVYERAPEEPGAPLVGTVWVLDSLLEGGGPDDAVRSTVDGPEQARLELGDDGSLLASSGCVTADGAEHEVVDGRLVTRFAFDLDYECGSDELWAQDRHVWEVLNADPLLDLEGQRLTLTGDDGLGLSYRAEVAPS